MSVPVRPSHRWKLLSLWKHTLVRAIAVPVLSLCTSLFLWNRFLFDRAIAREFLSIISSGCFTILSLSPIVYIESYGEVKAIRGDYLSLRMSWARIQVVMEAVGVSPDSRSQFAGLMKRISN